jgi:beta-alanine degradation protein BauB
MKPAEPSVTTDDGQVRVTTWTFGGRGSSMGEHRHDYNYIVVPVTGGILTVTTPDGAQHDMIQHAGSPYHGSAGTTHSVTNNTGQQVVFVGIELKR